MTFTRLTLGEPRLKGRVRGGAVEEPCVDSVTEGTVVDTSFEDSSSDWPGVLWFRQNSTTDLVGYRLPTGNYRLGFTYDESVNNNSTPQGFNSSNPVGATRDDPMTPGIARTSSSGRFDWFVLSDKHSNTGSWALGHWVDPLETAKANVYFVTTKSCDNSVLFDETYTGLALPGHVITVSWRGMVTNYGPRTFTDPGFRVRLDYTVTTGGSASEFFTVACAEDGAWRSLQASTTVPAFDGPAFFLASINVEYTKSGNNVYGGSSGVNEEFWLDDVTITVE